MQRLFIGHYSKICVLVTLFFWVITLCSASKKDIWKIPSEGLKIVTVDIFNSLFSEPTEELSESSWLQLAKTIKILNPDVLILHTLPSPGSKLYESFLGILDSVGLPHNRLLFGKTEDESEGVIIGVTAKYEIIDSRRFRFGNLAVALGVIKVKGNHVVLAAINGRNMHDELVLEDLERAKNDVQELSTEYSAKIIISSSTTLPNSQQTFRELRRPNSGVRLEIFRYKVKDGLFKPAVDKEVIIIDNEVEDQNIKFAFTASKYFHKEAETEVLEDQLKLYPGLVRVSRKYIFPSPRDSLKSRIDSKLWGKIDGIPVFIVERLLSCLSRFKDCAAPIESLVRVWNEISPYFDFQRKDNEFGIDRQLTIHIELCMRTFLRDKITLVNPDSADLYLDEFGHRQLAVFVNHIDENMDWVIFLASQPPSLDLYIKLESDLWEAARNMIKGHSSLLKPLKQFSKANPTIIVGEIVFSDLLREFADMKFLGADPKVFLRRLSVLISAKQTRKKKGRNHAHAHGLA